MPTVYLIYSPADPRPICKACMKRSSVTYPRTDSCYLTSDMADSPPVLVNLASPTPCVFRKGIAISCDAAQVINDKKVTDHHAVIPTRNPDADLSSLPAGEKAVLELVALRLLRRSPAPHLFGNGCNCRLCRWGVYRQRENGKAPRMESI